MITTAFVGGENGKSAAYQAVNGIQFSNWFSGIGLAIDNYRYKSLPLFVDGRRFFGRQKNTFIYGNLGYNFAMKNAPEKDIYYYGTYHFSGGVYTDLGIGYRFYLGKHSSLLFSLGNSLKKMQMKTEAPNQCLTGPCPVNYRVYQFNFNRLILQGGLIF